MISQFLRTKGLVLKLLKREKILLESVGTEEIYREEYNLILSWYGNYSIPVINVECLVLVF